ncbi:uncharacterized protein LOC128132878 [Lactuca sativa]|uniref:uncharacterized protein LOC128132878 n=1 Tax=Lactuca sativa TaxID=4236 RepID=UPI0022AFAF3F|nr:uncharacterized protein LOC128132878 [Lactuca sativa]
MKKEWKLYDRLMRLETGLGGMRSLVDASPKWWEEKIKENKDYAKFRNTDLSTLDEKYATLFRDSVAIGDQTMIPLQFQNNSNPNEENMEGKGDSDEINFDDDKPLFPSLHESSSSKRKRMDSDDSSSSNDNEEREMEEDGEFEMLCGLALKGIILAHNLRTQLCIDLATNYGLQQTQNVYIEEYVGIFLMTLAHRCSNRFVQEFFNHLGETIHKHFHIVLEAVLKLSADIIKPNANYNDDVPEYILYKPRYYPMFKDCIGAIYGTHVKASVPQKDEVMYIGRKGYATQNIMVVCDFNMCFTFVWAGWEGTTHDTKIFSEALQRPDLNFLYPTGDKYYIVNAGYPNMRWYLAPYKGTNIRYHLPDF